MQSYITCDGRKDVVRPHHLKLLAVLKQKCAINFLAYLNFLLHDAARSIRKSHHTEMVVSHHCLIRLIVIYILAQQQTRWEELVFLIDGGISLPAPKRKRITSTTNILLKCRHSSRLRRSRGMLGSLQSSNSQPLELPSSGDEKPPVT